MSCVFASSCPEWGQTPHWTYVQCGVCHHIASRHAVAQSTRSRKLTLPSFGACGASLGGGLAKTRQTCLKCCDYSPTLQNSTTHAEWTNNLITHWTDIHEEHVQHGIYHKNEAKCWIPYFVAIKLNVCMEYIYCGYKISCLVEYCDDTELVVCIGVYLSLVEGTNLFVISKVELRKIHILSYLLSSGERFLFFLRFAIQIWSHFSRQYVVLGEQIARKC